MIISDENYFPILIDSVDTPLTIDYFWVLDLAERDWKLCPLTMNEEMTTPSLELSVQDYKIEIPTSWNILIYSEDTSQLDIVEAADLTRNNYTAVAYNHKIDKIVPAVIKVMNYNISSRIYSPSLHKTQMLCHSLGTDHWICLSPTDNYNKFLKNATIGDLTP
jgi:hypothetical protein